MNEFEPSRADLVALIDWLALPYAADPDFVTDDEIVLPFVDTAFRRRLRATWEAVVGTKGAAGRPVALARCQTCGMMQFVPVESEEVARALAATRVPAGQQPSPVRP